MFENIRLSLKGILSHKIRSLLTMLGIIIGIAAIIAIVSTIEGTREEIKNNLIGSGSNNVRIQLMRGDNPYDFTYSGAPENVREIQPESKERIKLLKEVAGCTLYRTRNYLEQLYYKDTKLQSAVVNGIDEDYFDTVGMAVAEGVGFPEQAKTGSMKIAWIDEALRRGFFSGTEPVGEMLEICGEQFRIVGVLAERSAFEPTINSVDDYMTYKKTGTGAIYIPTQAWSICFAYDEPQNCVVRAVDTDSMTEAGKKAADILNENVRRSDMTAGDAETDDTVEYKSESLLEQAKALQDLSKSTNNMLIWIASISLLVGGIGVMNIMLVSVTERTREIGLKKALGARRGRILSQFLTEAVVLTSIGGLLGVLSGIGLSRFIANLAEVPVSISTKAIVISVVFSMLVGIIFGLIPSIKAANLNPIDALRYE